MSGQEKKYIDKAFSDNYIVPLGPNVDELEDKILSFLNVKGLHVVAMNSGTAAIHIALKLLEIKQGEEVFCSTSTFVATANPILYEKAVPIFIDSEPETWNICPLSLQRAIDIKRKSNSKIPRVLITVDLFGKSCNYDDISRICKENNIKIIEDSAEALGSTYKQNKCGVFGDYGIFSFNGNKIITTSGGGALVTHSKKDAQKALFLITQARDKAQFYLHSQTGYNYRMSNISAGIGIGQMNVIENRVNQRRNNFKIYKQLLKDCPVTFLKEDQDSRSNHWLSTILINEDSKVKPEKLIEALDLYNIEARRVWKPLHTQPLFSNNDFFTVHDKPVSEDIFERGLCLPSSSFLKEIEIKDICEIIKSTF